jgi:hypothetical protein
MRPTRLTAVALTILTVTATVGVVASASARSDHSLPRADSLVDIDTQPDGLRASAVHLQVTHAGGRLVAHVAITVSNPRATTARRFLTIEKCTINRCTASAKRLLVIAGGQTVSASLDGTLPASTEAITGALAVTTHTFPINNALIRLGSSAWVGPGAGRRYGITLTRRQSRTILNAHWHVSTTKGSRGTMRLRFGAAPDSVTTTLRRCAASCSSTTLEPSVARSKTAWDVHAVIPKGGGEIQRLGVRDHDGASLLDATLPWPSLSR